MAVVAARPKPQKHETRVHHRHGYVVVTCSCGWSHDTVSALTAWLASKHHLDEATESAPKGPKRSR